MANSGSRDLFKYIAYLKEGGVIPKIVYLNSETASNDEERASLFNKYFNSVFTVSSYTLPPDENLPIGDPDCADLEILEEDVLEILSCLDPGKAMGLRRWHWAKFSQAVCSCNIPATTPLVPELPTSAQNPH